MSFRARFRSWLHALLHRGDVERAMHDEMAFHVDRYAEDLRRRGVPAGQARRRALVEFGGIDARKEECRQMLGLRILDELRADLQYAVRVLRRSPAFTTVAILSLGLGIGANTAIFSLVDTILLKTLPVEDPERLVFIDGSGGKSHGSTAFPYPCFEILRDHNRHLTGMAAFQGERFKVTIDGAAEEITGQYASGSYFQLLGVSAAYGRVLTPADDSQIGRGGPDGAVAVISHALWKRRFGMSPSVLGRTIQVETRSVTIVGVTPPGFYGLTVGAPIDITVPMMLTGNALREKQMWWFSAFGRLKDHTTVEQARADLDAMFQAYMVDTDVTRGTRSYFDRIALVPAARGLHEVRQRFSTPLVIVMGIVGLVLLIGCANVANLLLARASARRTEIAVRLAMGAGRRRLIRQLLTEGLVLAAIGAAVGLAFAVWVTPLVAAHAAGVGTYIVLEPRFDLRVLAFTLIVASLTGLLFSLVPALYATRMDAARPDEGTRTSTARPQVRTGRVLVIVQVALSLVLLSGAALFMRTLQNLGTLDAGFHRDGVLTMQVDATLPEQPSETDSVTARIEAARIWEDLIARVGTLPGVRSASATTLSPMSGRDRGVNMTVIGGSSGPEQDPAIHLNHVTAEYFETLGIRLLMGRLFTEQDHASSRRVTILSDAAARAYFGDANPLGRSVTFFREDRYEIVGVVQDARYESLRDEAGRMVYVPMQQAIERIDHVLVAIRGSIDAQTLMPVIRHEVRSGVPGGFIRKVATIDQLIDQSLIRERLLSMLASFFGGLALALTCIGLYGVLSYAVLRRTREIGIRIAIGAQRSMVIWLVLREALALIATGVALGIPAVLGASNYVESQLFGVTPSDPIALTAAGVLLLSVAVAAAYLPARRASRVDPMMALRYE